MQTEDVVISTKSFFGTLLAFFEVSEIPKGISEETQSMLNRLSSIQSASKDLKNLESLLIELSELSISGLTPNLIEKVRKASSPANPPLLPHLEQRFNQEIALLASKDMSQFSKVDFLSREAQSLILAFMGLLSEVDDNIREFSCRELVVAASWYFEHPGRALKSAKKLSEAIRSRQISHQTIRRAKHFYLKSGHMKSETLRSLQRFIQETVKFYNVYACLNRLNLDFSILKTQTNPMSEKNEFTATSFLLDESIDPFYNRMCKASLLNKFMNQSTKRNRHLFSLDIDEYSDLSTGMSQSSSSQVKFSAHIRNQSHTNANL